DGLENVGTDRHIANSLGESLDHLEQDATLTDAVGRLLVENFIALKRAEIEELKGKDPAAIFDYYAPYL
ncbi:MAG: glutamine synthetase, partial [Steroidobacteraceae bacterium]